MNLREFIKSLAYKRSEIDYWLSGKSLLFSKYDPDLGYLQISRRCNHGVDGSAATYTYEEKTWTRRLVNYADASCRINTYGDSYTYGTQVNDGETWQEVLAAHLGEPIRNFGVGGFSVYQIYLRMMREEVKVPAKNLIVNIYDDDHARNIIGLRHFKFGGGVGYPAPPQPYVKANPATKEFRELNPCSSPEDLYELCDPERMFERFRDDLYLSIILAKHNVGNGIPEDSYRDIENLAEEYGMVNARIRTPKKLVETVNALYRRSAVYASVRVVEKMEAFAANHGRKVLYIGSYSPGTVGGKIKPGFDLPVPEDQVLGYSFDRGFRRFMNGKGYGYVDLLDAHKRDFALRRLSVPRYLKQYYVYSDVYDSHYSPHGNSFTAFAAKDKLVEMLDPKPVSYSPVVPSNRKDVCVALN